MSEYIITKRGEIMEDKKRVKSSLTATLFFIKIV